MNILKTVTDGVPSKGMAAWGSQLGPRRVEQVTAFILSIRNTEVVGKAPQGDPYTPEAETAAESSDVPAGEPIGEVEEAPTNETIVGTED